MTDVKLTEAQRDILRRWHLAAKANPDDKRVTIERLKEIRAGSQVKAVRVLIAAGFVKQVAPRLYELQ